MKKKWIVNQWFLSSFLLFTVLVSTGQKDSNNKIIFYFHGQILEQQGINATSPEFGAYQYTAILDSFRKNGFVVISEVRNKNTDVKQYAHKVVGQIDSLIKTGVKGNDITVIGASKGGLMAMYVSTFLKSRDVNFVILAGCFAQINEDVLLYGNILSIHEKSDNVGLSCEPVRRKSAANISHYKEIEINTGLKHGFLYSPLPEWLKPALLWANGNYNK